MNHFGYLGFRSFNLSTLVFSPSDFTKVNDLSTRVSHKSKTTNHFGSSGFGGFNLSTLIFFRSAFTRSPRFVNVCLPLIDDYKSLWIFKASRVPTSPHSLSPRVLSLEFNNFSTCVSHRSMYTLHFISSESQSFHQPRERGIRVPGADT
jgi:hypothetical protein